MVSKFTNMYKYSKDADILSEQCHCMEQISLGVTDNTVRQWHTCLQVCVTAVH